MLTVEAPGRPSRMRRRGAGVIFVTQLLDPADPVLGFVVDLLSPLAASSDRLLVIANELRAIPEHIDADFESLGKERGDGRLTRTLRYESLLTRLSRDRSFSGLFAHMCPVYASLASPVLRPRGMRVVLWFAHPADTWRLAIAERLSNSILTSLPGAYPRRSAKAIVVGQAIDTDRWRLVPPPKRGPVLRAVALGRTSSYKGFPVLIQAVKRAHERAVPIHLRLVGPATTAAEVRHRDELHKLVDNFDLGRAVQIMDGIPPRAVPELVAEADVVLNASQAGGADKTVFEAMATGRLVVVSNPVFADLLGGLPVKLSFPEGDADALVDRLTAIAELSALELEALGCRLRDRVLHGHSLSSWTEAVVQAVTGMPTQSSVGRAF
jgi:glycosyltransferase involved in cell wall biosynthesis